MSGDSPRKAERTALITGAGGGLGLACARRFAGDGLHLHLVDNEEALLAETEKAIAADGASVSRSVTDIRTRAACERAIADAVAASGRVDVLVNAAGVYPRVPILEISEDDWRFDFEVNVMGTYFMMVAAVADMRGRGLGHIVNVSSIDAFKAHPGNAHYAATKAAVVSLTRSFAVEVAPLGIRVNSVAPGPMATERAKASDWYAPMVADLPTQAPIEPAEVADLVAYLARPENVSIAGENLLISGAGVIA